MTPFFSIIIPVYNVAPYLRECLDSVLAQTFTDWEAICVDDGSTDSSGVILDEYAVRDSRFRVIHQSNSGVSAARNAALDVAKGKWFLFLDGDDILRADGLETFLPYVRIDEHDGILVHPYIPYWNGDDIQLRTIPTRVLVDNATTDNLVFGPYAANGFPFSRVYKRTVFGHLRFPVGVKMAEDVCFWFDALCVPAKWMILNAEYYLYRQRHDSVCGRKSPKDCEAVLDSVLYASKRISEEMGLGTCGARRYVKRWPHSPCEYLRIFVKRYRELTAERRSEVLVKAALIENLLGEWPFMTPLKWELWVISHRLTIFLPALHIVDYVYVRCSRGIRLLNHLREHGAAYALGKIKRQLLRQKEYARSN